MEPILICNGKEYPLIRCACLKTETLYDPVDTIGTRFHRKFAEIEIKAVIKDAPLKEFCDAGIFYIKSDTFKGVCVASSSSTSPEGITVLTLRAYGEPEYLKDAKDLSVEERVDAMSLFFLKAA